MRTITAVCATGLTAAVVLTGALVAGANANPALSKPPASSPVALLTSNASATATPAPTSITLPAGGVLQKRLVQFCDNAPALIKRADAAQTRLSADANTKGSLARLKGRVATASKNDHPKLAKQLTRRLDRRTAKLAKLPSREQMLTAASAECTTLNLPPTP